MDLVEGKQQRDSKQKHFSGLRQCFSLTASELSHKMAAGLSQAITFSVSAAGMHVCVCQMYFSDQVCS